MKKPTLVASAKPNDHKVHVNRRTYVYGQIRKLDYDKYFFQFMDQVAKTVLRRVKKIVKGRENHGSDLH